MPTLRVSRKGAGPFQVDENSNLMKELLAQGIPVASSCKGDGVCGKCKLVVRSSKNNELFVEAFTADEQLHLEKGNILAGQRLACQVQVSEDLYVEAPYW